MDWSQIYQDTFIPELPKYWNANFASFKRYLDVFYDENRGILIKPLETTGKVKGATGEFVTAQVDNLVVRNQWTNLFDNFTTADNDYYKMYTEPVFVPRDPCTYGIDTSVWNFPYEPAGDKVIDVNKPYYKIDNTNGPIFLANENLSQVVGFFFADPSGPADYEIVLDPCTGETFNVDASDGGSAYIELIATSYDASWGSTWTQYKYGADETGGSSGGGTVGPGTIGTIPVFGPTTTKVEDSLLYQAGGLIFGPDLSVGDVIIHNAIRDSSENILLGYGSPLQINDPNSGRDVSIYGPVNIDGSLSVNGKEMGIYDPSLSDDLKTPEKVGGIPADTSVAYLRGKTYEQIINDLLFPTVLASILTANSANLSGLSGGIQELGTLVTAELMTATYNPGVIKNGDESTGPNLTGDANFYTFFLPDGTVDGTYTALDNEQIHNFTGYNITFGTNVWDVSISYDAGSGTYTDNKGNPVTNLDSQRVAGEKIATSNTITGRRYAWYGSGGTTPVTSEQVRLLSNKVFLSASNTGTFDISIPPSTANVYFFVPIGKTVVVQYVESSFANVNDSFTTSPIAVNDAGLTPQAYESWDGSIGTGGYPSAATYRVTIT